MSEISADALSKEARLYALGVERRQTVYKNYKNVGDFQDGRYDCDFVSPYTKSASNVNSPVFVMLQDWASADFLSGDFCADTREHGRTRSRSTNKQLDRLLDTYFKLPIGAVYASNLFPFVKPKGMSAKIPHGDLVDTARTFALPQIEIVGPRRVVALGLDCYNALRAAIGLKSIPKADQAIATPAPHLNGMIWCQAHTSSLGQNTRNRGGTNRVSTDWETMAHWFNQGRQTES